MAERYTRRRMTDRKDGRRLRTISPLFQLSPFTMLDPSDAASSFTDSVDAAWTSPSASSPRTPWQTCTGRSTPGRRT